MQAVNVQRSHSISSAATESLRRNIVIGFDGSKYADKAVDYMIRNILRPGHDHVIFAVALGRTTHFTDAHHVFEQMGVKLKSPTSSVIDCTSGYFTPSPRPSPRGSPSPDSRPGSPNPYKQLPVIDVGTQDLDQVRFYGFLEQVTQAKIEECKQRLEIMDIIVTVDIRPGDPRNVLTNVCQDYSSDLLVVGSRGLGAFRRALVGSVSEWLVQNCEVAAVLVVRKKKAKKNKQQK